MEKLGWLDVFKGQVKDARISQDTTFFCARRLLPLVNLRQLWTSDLAGLLFGELYIYSCSYPHQIDTN